MSEQSSPVLAGWMKLYHPSGALASLPIPVDGSPVDYKAALNGISAALAAGFTVNLPGLEAGEQKEEIGYVIRMEKENKNASITPHIHLYSANDAVVYKILSVYLNDDQAVDDFEAATGVKLDKLKVYPGTAAPKRGESKQSDSYITKLQKPVPVVLRDNPKYDEKAAEEAAQRKEIYKVPKREFLRWANLTAKAEVPVSEPKPDPMSREANGATDKPKDMKTTLAVHQPTIDEFARWLRSDPTVNSVNERCRELAGLDKYTKRVVWKAITEYTKQQGWEFDDKALAFVPPVEVEQEPESPHPSGDPIPF